MTWVRIDDQYPHHPKMLAAGPNALALDVAGIAYSNRFGTDGFISDAVLPGVYPPLSNPRRYAQKLVEVCRWRRDDDLGGWWIHDIGDYQPSAQQQAELSKKRAEAGRRGGKASGRSRSNAEANATANATANGEASASGAASSGVEANANPGPVPGPVPEEPASTPPSKRDSATHARGSDGGGDLARRAQAVIADVRRRIPEKVPWMLRPAGERKFEREVIRLLTHGWRHSVLVDELAQGGWDKAKNAASVALTAVERLPEKGDYDPDVDPEYQRDTARTR